MAKLNILALGGLDEKQKRLYVLEIDSKMFIFDSGVYEPLNSDFGIKHFIPNTEYITQNRDKLKAVFLTSANRMNLGSLRQIVAIKNDVEIYGSKETLDSLDIFFKEGTAEWNKKEITKGNKQNIAGFDVEAINVPSIIPGTLGYKINTDDGNIIYMSDYMFDSVNELNISPMSELADLGKEKNLLFITDASLSTEKMALSSKFRLKNIVSKYFDKKQRFIVTVYEDEILNVIELINLAKEHKRKVFFKSKTLFNLIKMFMANGRIEEFPIRTFSDYKDEDREKAVVVLSGTKTKLYKTVELLIEAHNKADFAFEEEDNVCFAAIPQAGNEHVFADVNNKISRIDPFIIKPSSEEKKTFGTTEFDIRNMVNIIRPKFFLPVSAYYTQLLAATKIAVENGVDEKNIILGENGEIFTINKGTYEGINHRIKEIESKVVESGTTTESVSSELIEERKTIGKDGVVTISFIYNKAKLVITSDIDIQMKGVVISKGQEKTIDSIKELILQKSDQLSETNQSIVKGIPAIKKEVGRIFRTSINKVPSFVITVVEI